MKSIYLILLEVFSIAFPQICNAQTGQNRIDSLTNVLRKEGEDTLKVKTLRDLSWEFILISEYEQAMLYATEMKTLVERLIPNSMNKNELKSMKQDLATAFYFMGEIQRSQGNYEDAIHNFQQAKIIYEECGNKKRVVRALYGIGMTNFQKGSYADALKISSEALKICNEDSDRLGARYLYIIIGNVYNQQGNYPEALKNYLLTLKICEEIGDSACAASIYTNLGIVYESQENYAEAMDSYSAALRISQHSGDKTQMALSHDHIGNLFMLEENYPDALKNLFQSKIISEEIGDRNVLAVSSMHIGEVYSLQGDYGEALKNYFFALNFLEEINDQYSISNVYFNIANVYCDQKKYASAIDYFNRSIILSKEIGNIANLGNCYKKLSSIYVTQDNYKNAYQYHLLSYQLRDSIYNETKSQQIAELKTQYETEKKDTEIALLNKDKELQSAEVKKQKVLKYSFIGGLATLALLSGIVLHNFKVRNKLKLQTLRNKIASDLHDDVGSTLSSISIFSEIAQQQSSEVTPMLEQIGENSRKMLDAMADIVWTIHPENDQFEKIIERMQAFAFELLGARKIDFEFEVDETVGKMKLPMDVRKNLYLIFKEATNNLVKYAKADKASFSLSGSKNNLTMLIRDNGTGFDVHQLSHGNGIRNMKRRAEEIKAKLLIESEPGSGTTIQLLLHVA